MIAAGAVVTKNVPDYALMAGVPAKQIGWVSRTGEVLGESQRQRTGERYEEKAGELMLWRNKFMQFIDLKAQQVRIRNRIDAAIAKCLTKASIMGPEVKDLERQLATFCGAKHAITCANGTDALQLALMALVYVRVTQSSYHRSPSLPREVVPCMGAVPFFVDIDPATYNMDPASLERSISHAKTLGLNPKVVIPLFLAPITSSFSRLPRHTG